MVFGENKFINSKSERSVLDFKKFIEDPVNFDFKESVKGIFNYFESIATAANKGLIDVEFIFEFHDSIFKIYYIDYFYYIEYQRATRNNMKIWNYYTTLVEKWHPNIRADLNNKKEKSTIINI